MEEVEDCYCILIRQPVEPVMMMYVVGTRGRPTLSSLSRYEQVSTPSPRDRPMTICSQLVVLINNWLTRHPRKAPRSTNNMIRTIEATFSPYVEIFRQGPSRLTSSSLLLISPIEHSGLQSQRPDLLPGLFLFVSTSSPVSFSTIRKATTSTTIATAQARHQLRERPRG